MAAIHPSPPFDELTYYPTARWIRATRRGATAVDSRRAVLVWEPGKQVPIYAFPTEDVNVESLDGDRLEVRSFDDADLAGYVAVPWESLEQWFEEDEEVFIHPRDPFVRIDVLHSSRHVRAERDGQRLAESDAPILLFETGAPTRYYFPERDVEWSVLEANDAQTGCPYKGFASYHDVVLDGRRHPKLLWQYKAPFDEVAAIKGHLAPYNERVELIVDGQLQERPAGPLRHRQERSKKRV